jgi:hypothetical protein
MTTEQQRTEFGVYWASLKSGPEDTSELIRSCEYAAWNAWKAAVASRKPLTDFEIKIAHADKLAQLVRMLREAMAGLPGGTYALEQVDSDVSSREPLTDSAIFGAAANWDCGTSGENEVWIFQGSKEIRMFARAIERAHGIGEVK